MAKKIKNLHSKEALHRKRNAESELSALGMSIEDELLCIGIILKDLNVSELNRQCFVGINEVCKKFCGVDICVIPHNFDICPMLLCPIIDPRILTQWTYPIISTNVSTTITALCSKSDYIYFYVFDIENIPDNILNNNRIKLIAKDSNIANFLKNNAYGIIENFDIHNFINLINKELKNEEKGSNRAITI